MGPMALGDLVGQELFWKQRKVGGNSEEHTCRQWFWDVFLFGGN